MLILHKKRFRKLIQYILLFKSVRIKGVFLGRGSKVGCKLSIGEGSRLNANFFCRGLGEVKIGKYCAFGHHVRIITSNHPYNMPNLQTELQHKLVGNKKRPNVTIVEIGHNVWIGDCAIILPNVKIGNGAIIGAGAVVTKDVDAFSIVAGNPAKHIKYRFSKRSIIKINNSEWWNWSLEEMKNNLSFFMSEYNDE